MNKRVTNKRDKLVREWVELKVRLGEIDDELEKIYLLNPKKCEYCGKNLLWNSNGWVNQEGLSIQRCECLDGMG